MTGTGVTCIINVGNKKAFLDACEKGYMILLPIARRSNGE